jgi:hypothetical protein
MSGSSLHRVALQEPDLVLGEDDRVALSVLLESYEALVELLDAVARANPARATGTDVCAAEAQLIRSAPGPRVANSSA